MTGGVINTINTRLEAETIAYILDHSDAKLLITDTQFSPTVKKALELYGKKIDVIDIVDDQAILKEGREKDWVIGPMKIFYFKEMMIINGKDLKMNGKLFH